MNNLRTVICDVTGNIVKRKIKEMKRFKIHKNLCDQYLLIELTITSSSLRWPEGAHSRTLLIPKKGLIRLIRSIQIESLRCCLPELVDIFISMDKFGSLAAGALDTDMTIEEIGLVDGQVLYITHVKIVNIHGWRPIGPGQIFTGCCLCKTAVERQPNDDPPVIRVDGSVKCICKICMTNVEVDFIKDGKLPAKFSCTKCLHTDGGLTLKKYDTERVKYSIECSNNCKPTKKILCEGCGDTLPTLQVSCWCKIRVRHPCGLRIEVEQ